MQSELKIVSGSSIADLKKSLAAFRDNMIIHIGSSIQVSSTTGANSVTLPVSIPVASPTEKELP